MRLPRIQCAFGVLLFFLFILPSCKENPPPKVLATVNSHTITEEQFIERFIDFLLSAGVDDNFRVRQQVLNGMINEWLLADYADSLGASTTDTYQRLYDYRRKKAIIAAWKKKEILNKIEISEAELREAFVHFNEKIFARHLFAPTREQADSLYRLLQKGASFEELALKNFKDPRLAFSGGALGYIRPGDTDPGFEEVAFELPVGKVSPPVQTAQGYSIVKVEDRQRRPIFTETEFATKKKYIRRYLKWKKQELLERERIQQMIDRANLQFDADGLNALLQILSQVSFTTDYQGNLLFTAASDDLADQYNLPCLTFNNQVWDVQAAMDQLTRIQEKHFRLIKDIHSLKLALRGLVARELIYQEALEKGYAESREVRQNLGEAAKQAKIRYVLGSISDTLSATEDELLTYYQSTRREYYHPEMVKTQVLVVEDSLQALAIKREAAGGGNFDQLVSRYSLFAEDDPDNGIIDWSPRGKFAKYADRIFALRPGEIAGPFRKGNFFFLVKLVDHRPRQQKSFEEVREQVRANVLFLKRQESYKTLLRRLRKAGRISINQEVVRNISMK